MQTKVVAVAIVVILIACGVIAAIALSDNKKTPQYNSLSDVRLQVYGNANNDDYLDESDIELIQAFIDGDMEWDQEEFPYADTNCDGIVNEEDIRILTTFINKESGETMYYTDSWGGVSSVTYPVTGTIGTMYWEAADLAILLGLWPRVIACGNGSLNETKNPGFSDMISYGSGYDVEPEVVFASGVDSLITYNGSDGTAAEIKAAAEQSGIDMEIICLPSDFSARVAVAGVLYQCEDKSNAWMESSDGLIEYMNTQLAGIDEGDAPTVVTIMLNSSSDLGNIRILGPSTSSPHGLFRYMSMTPANVLYPDDWSSYFTTVDIEWVYNQDPDYIIFVSSGAWPSDSTDDEIDEHFVELSQSLFGETRAYQNGNIIATANGTMGGFQASFALLMLISSMFEQIDSDYAEKVYNDYFAEFTYFTTDDLPSYKIRYLHDLI